MSKLPVDTNDSEKSAELENHIQALPQELQDMILDFTLIAAIEGVQAVVDDPPPWQISVNSRTRKIVAPKFYGTASFVVPERVVIARESPHLHLLTEWLKKVPAHYHPTIREIRIRSLEPARPESIEEEVQLYSDQMRLITATEFVIGRRGNHLSAEVMKLPCHSNGNDPAALTWLTYDEFGRMIDAIIESDLASQEMEERYGEETESDEDESEEDESEEDESEEDESEEDESEEDESEEDDDCDHEATG